MSGHVHPHVHKPHHKAHAHHKKAITLTDALRKEYNDLFSSCKVTHKHRHSVTTTAERIVKEKDRYDTVGLDVTTPWWVIGIIHALEGNLKFTTHLHNGDPLTARTVHVPAGRPVHGKPPFDWETSAVDALRFDGFDRWTDWTLSGALFKFEAFNGFGYRNLAKPIHSPYLWSFTNHYTKGKFGRDNSYDAHLVSKQAGAAALLRILVDKGHVTVATS
jgi:lysozyme family protein